MGTQFQLSRVSSLCLGLWRQDLRNNVVKLLKLNLADVSTIDPVSRALKREVKGVTTKTRLVCVTLHMRFDKAGLGQFLTLSKGERRVAGRQFTERLVERIVEVWRTISFDFDHLSLWVQHDADLKHKDLVALTDLLWTFPQYFTDLWEGGIMDAQWWLSSCVGSAPRQKMSWDCLRRLDEDLWGAPGPCKLSLDSSCAFKD